MTAVEAGVVLISSVMKELAKWGHVEQGVSPARHAPNPQWAFVLPSCGLKEDILLNTCTHSASDTCN